PPPRDGPGGGTRRCRSRSPQGPRPGPRAAWAGGRPARPGPRRARRPRREPGRCPPDGGAPRTAADRCRRRCARTASSAGLQPDTSISSFPEGRNRGARSRPLRRRRRATPCVWSASRASVIIRTVRGPQAGDIRGTRRAMRHEHTSEPTRREGALRRVVDELRELIEIAVTAEAPDDALTVVRAHLAQATAAFAPFRRATRRSASFAADADPAAL